MLRKIICAVALSAISFSCALAEDQEQPKAPKGYSWKSIDTLDLNYLVPDGWHLNVEFAPGTIAIFITKEDYHGSEEFKTGMSVNIFLGVGKRLKKGVTLIEHSKQMVDRIEPRFKIVERWDFEVSDRLYQYGARSFTTANNGEIIWVHLVVIANWYTGTIYTFNFETREATFDEEWPIGMKLMKYLALDDDL